MKDSRFRNYTVTFVARNLDEGRLKQVLAHNFQAKEMSVASELLADERGEPPNWRPRPTSVEGRILALLEDGRIWRCGAIAKTLDLRPQATSHACGSLVECGFVRKIAHGKYAVAGLPEMPTEEAPSEEKFGESVLKVLDLVERPRSLAEIRDLCGFTRQRADQILKKLMAAGRVRRVNNPAEAGRWLYVRKEMRSDAALVDRPPRLPKAVAAVLSGVPPGETVTVHGLVDLLKANPISMAKRLDRLTATGLLDLVELGIRRIKVLRLTARGAAHPQYLPGVPKAEPYVHDKAVDSRLTEILLVIATLGEARSLEITLLTGIGRTGRRQTGFRGVGNFVQQLEAVGLVEPVRVHCEGKKKPHPMYRLTISGQQAVAVLRGQVEFPDPEALARRRDEVVREYWQQHRERGRAQHGPQGRTVLLSELLREHGPLPTDAINEMLSDPYPNPRSIHLALRTLVDRGEARKLSPGGPRDCAVWDAIRPPAADSPAMPTERTDKAESRAHDEMAPSPGLLPDTNVLTGTDS